MQIQENTEISYSLIAKAYRGLGNKYLMEGKAREAIKAYKSALVHDPQTPSVYPSLGYALTHMHQFNLANQVYRIALAKEPHNLAITYEYLICQLPSFYGDDDSIHKSREIFTTMLTALERSIMALTDEQIGAMPSIYRAWPYYLAYQGENDCALQEIHGRLLVHIMSKKYPHFSTPPAMPSLQKRIRLGFVSGFFQDSSVWKIPLQGWLTQMDSTQFEIFGYYVASKKDGVTKFSQSYVDYFYQSQDLEELAKKIRSDDLHAIIFLDIGMEPISTHLACLKLAPIQCTSLGHPVTTGLSTIDYFLSSELMETDSGQQHYSETLIQLPGLGIYYEPPVVNAIPWKDPKEKSGLQSMRYLCCQTLFKYLPFYDEVIVSIARQVPTAQFIFIRNPAELGSVLMDRLRKVFQKYGLQMDDFVVFLPKMSVAEFAGLCGSCDLFLDSIGWSGFNTTMEALNQGLPVLTCSGLFARSNHTKAILQAMNLESCLANDVQEYVEKAVSFGNNKNVLKDLSRRVKENYPKICRDKTAIRALENFLQTVVQEKLIKNSQ